MRLIENQLKLFYEKYFFRIITQFDSFVVQVRN